MALKVCVRFSYLMYFSPRNISIWKLDVVFHQSTVSKNKYVRFEWLLECNMEKALFSYFFKVLIKTLIFAEWFFVAIPRTVKLVFLSRFRLSIILFANYCPFIKTCGKAWITWRIECLKQAIMKTAIQLSLILCIFLQVNLINHHYKVL